MLAEFSIAPFDKGESLSTYVAQIIDLIDNSGLDYRLGAMGTTVEGDCDEVFELIKACHQKMRSLSKRVITHIAIDDREGAVNRLEGKPGSIEEKLGKKLRK
ncbi:MAG TPA: MTH1187 family thiamine-binding protein [bacterium]|nr:MTH1187 family thiamine-binding protein [bacterium]